MSELFIRKIFLSLVESAVFWHWVSPSRPRGVCLCSHTVQFGKPLGNPHKMFWDLSSALPTQMTAVSRTYNIYFFHFSSVTLELCLAQYTPRRKQASHKAHFFPGSQSCTSGISLPENRCSYFVQFHSFAMAGKSNTHYSFMVGSINLDRFKLQSCLRC